MSQTTHFIGRDDDGMRYFVDINLDAEHNATRVGKSVEFTDHSEGHLEHVLSVTGFGIEKRRREASIAGQMHDHFGDVTKPADGWTLDDIASLVSIAKEWHLNDMNAWSDEQHEQAKAVKFDFDQLRGVTDSTGYKYGSAWLARQIPGDVVKEIERLQSLPTGNVPASY